METIKQQLDTYKEIKDSIEVKIPNKLVEKTSPDIVETINQTVNQQLEVYLSPIKGQLNTLCEDIITKINTLILQLKEKSDYIQSIQDEIK